jgi:transposase-like protein
MAKQQSMNLIEFQQTFNTEQACHEHLYRLKWPNGFQCPKCHHDQAYEIKTRQLPLYECKQCHHQTTVKAGTIFEKSRKSLVTWFWAIYLIAHDKRGVSATFLADELNMSYQTAWTMQHKIRKAMGDRDANYSLSGIVEVDESFWGAPTEGGKRGRGTERTIVLTALSLNARGNPLYAKMKVIPDVKAKTIREFAQQHFQPGTTVVSDWFRSYRSLGDDFQHIAMEFNPERNPDHLHWLHTVISNAKAFIAGTYHGLDSKHLHSYLHEFCFRFNRRNVKSELFNRLLHSLIPSKTASSN